MKLALPALALALLVAPIGLGESGDDDADSDAPRTGTDRDGAGREDGHAEADDNETSGRSGGNESDLGRGDDGGDSADAALAEDAVPDAPFPLAVGPVTFTVDGDRVLDLRIDGVLLFSELLVPGLGEATELDDGSRLVMLRGEDARLAVSAQERVVLVARSDDGDIVAILGEAVEARERDGRVALRFGGMGAAAQGEHLELDDGTLTAGETLTVVTGNPELPPEPSWAPRREFPPALALPVVIEGRYLGFTLTATGIQDITVHGVPLGSIEGPVGELERAAREGPHVRFETTGATVAAEDVPSARLMVAGAGFLTDLPATTQLASGATVVVETDDDGIQLRVERPPDALPAPAPAPLRPVEIHPIDGGAPGLETRQAHARLGIESARPGLIAARFEGALGGSEGEVGLELGLVRALLVQDVDGDGQVGIGEPAVATALLASGTTEASGDTLRATFALWSGTLTLSAQLGEDRVKITYEAHGLEAPPGTLFVLESVATAPGTTIVEPTAQGVVVRNGALEARYSLAGPVTVDGVSAWAHQAVLVQPDGTVHLLVTYPAGDSVVHDPTLQIQSVAAALPAFVASPVAVALGAITALVLVGVTVAVRRRA